MKKLFDLQTGKYLELGKDWLDGANYIIILAKGIHVKDLQYIKDNPYHQNTDHELNTRWNSLFKDCVYGVRYVLVGIAKANMADVIKIDQQGSYIRYHYGLGSSFFPFEVIGNLIKEYSKNLRSEENRLEEFERLLGFVA